MICSERERLLESYRAAVEAYAVAVTALKLAAVADFPREYARADECREKCDHLRERIENHRKLHGC